MTYLAEAVSIEVAVIAAVDNQPWWARLSTLVGALLVVGCSGFILGMKRREEIIRQVWGGDTAQAVHAAWVAGFHHRPFPSEPLQ